MCVEIFLLREDVKPIFPASELQNLDFQKSIAEKLAAQKEKLENSYQGIANSIERLLDIEKSVAKQTGKEVPPNISPETMRALLKIYGANASLEVDRREAVEAARAAMKNDPYFNWLLEKGDAVSTSAPSSQTNYILENGKPVSQRAPRDPVAYLESMLLISRANALPLTLALWKLRAEMEPNLHIGTRAGIDTLVAIYKQQMVLESLQEQLDPSRPYGMPKSSWSYAQNLKEAQSHRKQLLEEIRVRAEDKLPLRIYEILKEQLTEENSDVEMVRQYILAQPGGTYEGKVSKSDLEFLEVEVKRIRDEWNLPKELNLDREFLALWPLIWGQKLPYEIVLLRRYFEFQESQRLETLLRNLNTIIEVSLVLENDPAFREYLESLVR